MAAPPPAQPTAILRGHRAQVNAATFVRLRDDGSSMTADTRLATGDSDGFVVLWDLAILRPRAVWRAHQSSILGLAGWDSDSQIVTHGRDNKLIVWQVGVADEARLSTELPLDGETLTKTSQKGAFAHPQPWIVHVLEVNTMNFCAFAWCGYAGTSTVVPPAQERNTDAESAPSSSPSSSLTERLIAVPNTLTLEAADIYHLPSQQRINTVKLGAKEGMIMALALFYSTPSPSSSTSALILVAAFENGVAVVASLDGGSADGHATIIYRSKSHSEPILSLDIAPGQSYFLTSAADAIVVKHPIPVQPTASAGKEGRVSANATAQPLSTPPPPLPPSTKPVSLLSAALAKETASSTSTRHPVSTPPPTLEPETQPLKIVDTKHAGQQGLRIRGDGRLFATAGWDSRVRVYSVKTMKELAVLKWHQDGCFAVAFAPVPGKPESSKSSESGCVGGKETAKDGGDAGGQSVDALVATATSNHLAKNRTNRDISVKERRLRHAVTAHWLAAGSKDGKVSLWDIF